MNGRRFLLSWFYAALLTGAALSCPVTAFELPVSLPLLWTVSVLAAGLLSLLWHLPGRYVTLSCAALCYLAALWRFRETILSGFSAALETVTDIYAQAYPGWTAISLMRVPADTDATLCFAAIAIPLAALLVWTLRWQTGAWLQSLVCAPWLGLCMVVVGRQPALWALVLLVGTGLLLVLTQDLRQQDDRAGLRLTALLLIPTALLAALPAWLSPPADYERANWPDAWRETLNEGISRLSGVEFGQNGAVQWQPAAMLELLWTAEHDEVDLSALGDRRSSGGTVMELQAEVTERIYLRGASLTEYRNNAWRAASISTPLEPLRLGRLTHTVHITTRGTQSVVYMPYYPAEVPGVQINDEYYYNADELQSYSVDFSSEPVVRDWSATGAGAGYLSLVYQVYCQLPTETADALLVIAEEAGLTALPAEQQPDAAADFVRNAASYSLSPEAMPWDADFPVWFLTEAEEGYCVHFATATATLLRAMGIPARYVTGFVADARAGRWVEITDRDAHAWVEYWRDDIGWVPLESTPGESRVSGSLIALPEEPEPAVPDAPEEALQPDSPEPEPPEIPDAPDETDTPVLTEQKRSMAWLGWALLVLMGLAALIGSRWLRIGLRRRQVRGDANAQALSLWRQIERLSRHSGATIPQELKRLAQKARFSRHTLSADELAQFHEYTALLTERLRAEPGLWQRFRNRWIWADC